MSSLPEHSNSDVEGSITSEDLFGRGGDQVLMVNSTTTQVPEDWLKIFLESPWILGIAVGGLISVMLIIIGFCVVANICW